MLTKFFEEKQDWNEPTKIHIAEEVGLNYDQVSKWYWDERKKRGIDTKRKKAHK